MPDDEYEQMKQCIIGSEPRTELGTHVPTSLVEELQNERKIEAFETLTNPSIHHQYIGKFPDKLLPEGQYDFIYDSHGPLYYVDMEQRGTRNDALVKTYDLLSEHGMLYASQFWPSDRAEKVQGVLPKKYSGDSAPLFLQGNDTRLLVIQPGNPLYEQTRTVLSEQNYRCEGGVTRLQNDTEILFESILGVTVSKK
jgi:hypothetical protein